MKFLLVLVIALCTSCAKIDKADCGCTGPETAGADKPASGVLAAGLYLADMVISAPGHTGVSFYDSAKATNGVRGAGAAAGGLDVFSLDNTGASSQIVFRWAGKKIKNGTGIDFIVFENGFYYSGNPQTRFMDLVFVEVSNDNINYCGFGPDYVNSPETTYTTDPTKWQRFGGKTPVLYNIDSNNLSAAQTFQDNDANGEPDLAGGDGFDLSNLSSDNTFGIGCNTTIRDDLLVNGFTFLRLTPAFRRNNPATGAAFVAEGVSNGPDIDGVIARFIE